MPRLLGGRLMVAHSQIHQFDGTEHAILRSVSADHDGKPRPFPVQVDGDYIGERTELELSVVPSALRFIA